MLDQGQIAQVAQQAGITEDQAADVLAEAIPAAVDRATPDGRVPDDAAVDAELQGRVGLSRPPGAVRRGPPTRSEPTRARAA